MPQRREKVSQCYDLEFLGKELGRFSYKLQMATSLTEDHGMRRKSFAQYFRMELINDAGNLKGLFSPINTSFFVWISKQAKL